MRLRARARAPSANVIEMCSCRQTRLLQSVGGEAARYGIEGCVEMTCLVGQARAQSCK